MAAKNFKETTVYKKAFSLAMNIFEISKAFLKEEKYSLTDQMRRSSRSVCANMAEAYRKRLYPAHFVSKISDCDAENSETGVWLDFALSCQYITEEIYQKLNLRNEEIGKMLHHMINNPEKY
ncbi:four helix bundle protein [Marivirga sp.]|uniref:four helix bundle protein n=1 Tax=Marivirga sp. TaxID=2018662 RepID=UPI003DA72CDC